MAKRRVEDIWNDSLPCTQNISFLNLKTCDKIKTIIIYLLTRNKMQLYFTNMNWRYNNLRDHRGEINAPL